MVELELVYRRFFVTDGLGSCHIKICENTLEDALSDRLMKVLMVQ
jgi:hypothetical protein